MNIGDMTIDEAREVARMFDNINASPTAINLDPTIGQYCIVRCRNAGVHAGIVVSVDGNNVVLRDSRRLWQWKTVAGISLSSLANQGVDPGSSRIAEPLKTLVLSTSDVCERIPCSAVARKSIEEADHATAS